MRDADLLQSWRDGDASGGEELVRRYYDPVRAFFRRKVSAEAAEDLVQSVFEVLCQTSTQHPMEHGLRPHIFAIARFKLLEYYRRHSRWQATFDPLLHTVEDSAVQRSMVSLISLKRDLAGLYIALRRLPLDAQILVELKHHEQFTEPELAVMFEISPDAVKSRARRARARLREELQRLDEAACRDLDDAERLRAYLSELREQISGE